MVMTPVTPWNSFVAAIASRIAGPERSFARAIASTAIWAASKPRAAIVSGTAPNFAL